MYIHRMMNNNNIPDIIIINHLMNLKLCKPEIA